jgi:hypothetical protein
MAKVYRYTGNGRNDVVRCRRLRGAFAEIRRPKEGYRLGRTDLLVGARSGDAGLFAALDG